MNHISLTSFREEHLSSLTFKFWHTVFHNNNILVCAGCYHSMTVMKPHLFENFTKLRDIRKLKAAGNLIKHWSGYGTDIEKNIVVSTLAVSALPGHHLGLTTLPTTPGIFHGFGENRQKETIPEGAHQRHWWQARQMTCGLCRAQWGRHWTAFSASHHCNCWGF